MTKTIKEDVERDGYAEGYRPAMRPIGRHGQQGDQWHVRHQRDHGAAHSGYRPRDGIYAQRGGALDEDGIFDDHRASAVSRRMQRLDAQLLRLDRGRDSARGSDERLRSGAGQLQRGGEDGQLPELLPEPKLRRPGRHEWPVHRFDAGRLNQQRNPAGDDRL